MATTKMMQSGRQSPGKCSTRSVSQFAITCVLRKWCQNVKSKDVGEIFKVRIKQIDDATTVDDKWTPAWLKVHLGQ